MTSNTTAELGDDNSDSNSNSYSQSDGARREQGPESGETSLPTLLRTMRPVLHPSTFYICTLPPPRSPQSLQLPAGIEVQCLFREPEGWTVIVPTTTIAGSLPDTAPAPAPAPAVGNEGKLTLELDKLGLVYDKTAEFGMVTLTVHSSLQAVGLTAAIAQVLAREGLGCNVVAGYFHDHIFLPVEQTARAMAALEKLARGEA
ncbi:hypothetical protein MBLNU459_g8131t1 [Dothideomycetes sp. NU459]